MAEHTCSNECSSDLAEMQTDSRTLPAHASSPSQNSFQFYIHCIRRACSIYWREESIKQKFPQV
ncbi:hypothetical protein PYCCODRAFT_1430000 [Trametes coccinea BRFM310]|uniref:Uncharacterized protein n=1 Tax=Trametes coccinea (strain BRFM310) TaxID=1353009 RepID=A0A1Y2J6E1_TRAC3|nr:hypothetical protein PYCCODRAFT_1430000 [Trametes coccinea BRFM310]